MTDCEAEDCPVAVAGNMSEAVFSVSVGALNPRPVSSTVCTPAPSVRVNVPVAGPVCAGVNASSIWQPEFAASEIVPHALPAMVNGGVTATDVMGTADPLLLAT